MSKVKYKDLVLAIKKYAGADDDGAPAPKPVGGGGKGVGGVPGTPGKITPQTSVVRMQEAMQSLASEVVKDSSMQSYKESDAFKPGQKPLSTDQTRSKKGFADFIAEQYTDDLDDSYKGVQFDKDVKKDTAATKIPSKSAIHELDVVMDTIKRIGNEFSGEFKPDGFWGFRTDNALKNIMGFAYALLQIEGDFKIPKSNAYNIGNWNALTYLVSGYEVNPNNMEPVGLSVEERSKRAMEIYKHLLAIKKLYIHMKTRILTQPMYKSYIQGDNTFDVLPKGITEDTIKASLDKTVKVKSPYWDKGDKGSLVIQPPAEHDIPLSALQDVNSFKAFMKNVLHCPENSIDQQLWDTYNSIMHEMFYAKDEEAPVEPVAAPAPTAPAAATPTAPKSKMVEKF